MTEKFANVEVLELQAVTKDGLGTRDQGPGSWNSGRRDSVRRLHLVARAPLADEIRGGFRPVGKLKLKSCFEQAAGNDAAALEDQLGLAAQKERADGR